ncbi:unnamed protein product [Brachionus calyciflorus]|uniref:Amino acid transporter n=1 Tax=Brachionus calyciflorus TaxID=104777 RepID=A0A813V9K1_9BILA|nr:unnamed protein product [Brachionus calyciflorus]
MTKLDNWLLVSILLGILIGFGLGIGLKNAKFIDKESIQWFFLPGNLFIRSIELLILPVIFISVVAATGSLNAKSNLKITLICISTCFLTLFVASLTGLAGSLILLSLSPSQVSSNKVISIGKQKTTYDIIADILRNLIPKNIIKATTNQEMTRYSPIEFSNFTKFTKKVEYIDGTNILGVLIFALLIGLSASVLDKKAEIFREFFKACNDVVILALRCLILTVPIGVVSLIIKAIYEIEDLGKSFKKICLFAGLCIGALLFYSIVILGLMLFLFMRKNPFRFYYKFLDSMLLAFATTSATVCIHKSIDICENDLKIDSRLTRFAVPLYTTLKADGSTIFIVMSCVFLANYAGVELNASDYGVIVLMTTILCSCIPSVPSASIVTILVVLNSINFTNSNIAVLYTVEWLLDRFRTAVNTYSNCFCTVITYELCKNNLDNLETEPEEAFVKEESQIQLTNLSKKNLLDIEIV